MFESSTLHGEKKKRVVGRKGDPRMNRAVAIRESDPNISLADALIAGGFEFSEYKEDGSKPRLYEDHDGISLSQKKNQLIRRLRVKRKREMGQDENGEGSLTSGETFSHISGTTLDCREDGNLRINLTDRTDENKYDVSRPPLKSSIAEASKSTDPYSCFIASGLKGCKQAQNFLYRNTQLDAQLLSNKPFFSRKSHEYIWNESFYQLKSWLEFVWQFI